MEHEAVGQPDPQLRRRVRRSTLFWSAVAAFFYLGFIVLTLVRGSK
jgi:hypothetical protein